MHDVIVVGAGPAGASAAYELAQRGVQVLMLERAKLPRYKPCGGAIPLNFFRSLPPRAQATLEAVMQSGSFLGPHRRVFGPITTISVAAVMRDRFDYEFTMAAVDEGAELIDANRVTGIEEQPDQVLVKTSHGVLAGRFLICADGAAGISRKALHLGSQDPPGVGLEVEIRPGAAAPLKRGEFVVHATLIRDGYSWVFAKGEIHSVGIASFGRDRKRVKEKLSEWVNACGYRLEGEVIHGHPIPVWRGRARLSTRRSLVVGDAASAVDPLGGEGIRYAIISGRIAAEFVSRALETETICATYTEAMHQAIHADFVHARWLAALFYRFPEFFFDLWVRTPVGADLWGKVLYGELRYRDLFQKALRTLLKPRAYRRLFAH